MNILVTGGAGFIGSHLCEALISKGHSLTVLDDLSSGNIKNLSSCIDLIDFKYPNSYANFWHTLDDLPENCSAESLGQVGTLMVDYIYNREGQNWSDL